MSCSFSSSSSSSSCSSSKLVSRKRKKSTDDGATEEIANSKDNRLTCRECGKKIPPSKSKSHICKSCDREKSCQYQREKRRLAQLAVQRLPLHLPNEQEYQQDNTKRAKLAASVETQREIDMEADKENRDTQNLLVFPQTPSKKERTAAEQQLQFATPMKTRQMNTCLSSPMFTVAVKQIQAQAMNQCRIQQQHFIQCINFAERREQQMQSEMNANKMEIERKEALFEREKNHLQLKVEHLHNKIEIAKKRKREVESKYIVVKKARKAVVGKRQMQYNCQKLMQILKLMRGGNESRVIDLITMCASWMQLKILKNCDFKISFEELIYRIKLISTNKAGETAQLINSCVGTAIITSRATYYRHLNANTELPFALPSVDQPNQLSNAVGYSDVSYRLELLRNASPSPHRQLRISSDKGGGCIKTSVAFANTQSVHHVQVLQAVVEDESYDVISKYVFPLYREVQNWCSQQNIALMCCCDLKMTSLLLGHKGQGARHPCCWCTQTKLQFRTSIPFFPRSCYRTLPDIHQQAINNDTRLSICHVPLDCISMHRYSPAPMHVFLGLINNILKYEWIPTLGADLVKSILHGRGVYFERYCGHSLSGNGVKNLLNCYPGILADLVPHTTPLFRHLYAQYFSNLLEMYRLRMRVDTLNVLDFSRYNLLCYRYMDYRKDCLRNVHNNEWHRELTPKEHTMLCHFERFMTDHQSLGRFSEQSHEAIHHAFNSIADRYCGKHELIGQLPFILRRANEQHLYLSDPNA